MIKLKDLLFENMDLQKFVPMNVENMTFVDFLKSMVGKRISDLLDVTSFARLFIMNKYGFSVADRNDLRVLLTELFDFTTNYINFRKISPLRKQVDDLDAEDKKRPEVIAYNKERMRILKAAFDAARRNDTEKANEFRRAAGALKDPSSYSKNMKDMQDLVHQFHNSPLTLQDVMPSDTDSPEDKRRLASAEKVFDELKQFLINNKF